MDELAPVREPNPIEKDVTDAIAEFYATYTQQPSAIILSRKVLKEYFRHEFPDHTEEALVRRVALSEKNFQIRGIPVTVIPGKSMEIVCTDE